MSQEPVDSVEVNMPKAAEQVYVRLPRIVWEMLAAHLASNSEGDPLAERMAALFRSFLD